MDNPKWTKGENGTFQRNMTALFDYISKNGYPKKDTDDAIEYQMYSRLKFLSNRPDLMALLTDKQAKIVKERPQAKKIKSQSKQNTDMAAKKPTGKAAPRKKGMTTRKTGKVGSVAQQKSQARIRRISDEATRIQKQGGTKTIPAKSVFKVNRADAVKKAAKTVK